MDLSDCIEGKGEKAREIAMTFPSKQLLNRPALEDGPGNLGRQQVRSGAELIRVKQGMQHGREEIFGAIGLGGRIHG